MNKFEELLDHVDAAAFTGDSLADKENLETFRYYLERWKRKADEWEEFQKEFGEEDESN